MLTGLDWLMIAGYFGLLAGVVVFTMMRRKIRSGEDLFRRVACDRCVDLRGEHRV